MQLRSFVTRIGLTSSVSIAVICLAGAGAREETARWATFSNPMLDYSFRYPAELRLERPPVADFSMAGLVDAVDLKAGPESELVLRVLVLEASGNPLVPVNDPQLLRSVCKTYEEMQIDGRLAINCVSCGRASCAWTVYVPGAREFRMLSGPSDTQEGQSPQDGRFPIRSIINGFRWQAAGEAR